MPAGKINSVAVCTGDNGDGILDSYFYDQPTKYSIDLPVVAIISNRNYSGPDTNYNFF